MSFVDHQLSKIIGIILYSKNILFTHSTLVQLTILFINFFQNISRSIQKYAELQRKNRPTIEDLILFMKLKQIKCSNLYYELINTKKMMTSFNKNILEKIEKQTSEMLGEMKTFQDTKREFEKQKLLHKLNNVITNVKTKPDYILDYLPDLPPDHTYHYTPKYTESINDLKKIRIQLVEESLLISDSLYNLIENKKKKWKNNFQNELENFKFSPDFLFNDNFLSKSQEFNETCATSDTFSAVVDLPISKNEMNLHPKLIKNQKSSNNTYSFNIIEYVQKKKRIIENKILREKAIKSTKDSNIFLIAEKFFSPHTSFPSSLVNKSQLSSLINYEFKNVMKSVRLSKINLRIDSTFD